MLAGEFLPLIHGVMLVYRGEQFQLEQTITSEQRTTKANYLGQLKGHFEGAHRVHVRGDDRNALVGLLAVPEDVLPCQIDIRSTFQCRAFRTDENVLEVEFDIVIDMRHVDRFERSIYKSQRDDWSIARKERMRAGSDVRA